jgi:Tfp pilus assembly protein PilF
MNLTRPLSLDNAIEIKSDYTDAMYNKALIVSRLGRFQDSISSYDDTLKANPNDEIS